MIFILIIAYIIVAAGSTYFYGRFFNDDHEYASSHGVIFGVLWPLTIAFTFVVIILVAIYKVFARLFDLGQRHANEDDV